mmetsp:Transcript_15882/g.36494  ORF Transcript_15882/g.36494 Transcript_15882/m.36494 type:complete len:571 (+) Transcript_15882:340-2052(+)
MWPRTAEERSRNRHTGFVCFMNRQDAEDAMNTCNESDPFRVGRKLMMRWGKNVKKMVNREMGAPIPRTHRRVPLGEDGTNRQIPESAIHVEFPKDPLRQRFISTVASFVARDGTAAENHLLQKEANNPAFRFLVCDDDPSSREEHIFYRWRVYSFAQGDSMDDWRTEPFRMVRGGRLWVPPKLPQLKRPRDSDEEWREQQKAQRRRRGPQASVAAVEERLSEAELEELTRLTRSRLCASRDSICQAMAFCLSHSGAYQEICTFLRNLLMDDKCSVDTRVARLYLLSDILFNSQQPGVKNAFRYRDAIEKMAPDVFAALGQHGSRRISLGRMTLQKLKTAVSTVLSAWTNWSVYNPAFLDELDARFHGREVPKVAAEPTPAPDEATKEPEPEKKEAPTIILDQPQGDWTEVNDEDEEESTHAAESTQTRDIVKEKEKSPESEKPDSRVETESNAVADDKQAAVREEELPTGEGIEEESDDDDIDGEPLEEGDLDEEGLKMLETYHKVTDIDDDNSDDIDGEPLEEDDGLRKAEGSSSDMQKVKVEIPCEDGALPRANNDTPPTPPGEQFAL